MFTGMGNAEMVRCKKLLLPRTYQIQRSVTVLVELDLARDRQVVRLRVQLAHANPLLFPVTPGLTFNFNATNFAQRCETGLLLLRPLPRHVLAQLAANAGRSLTTTIAFTHCRKKRGWVYHTPRFLSDRGCVCVVSRCAVLLAVGFIFHEHNARTGTCSDTAGAAELDHSAGCGDAQGDASVCCLSFFQVAILYVINIAGTQAETR